MRCRTEICAACFTATAVHFAWCTGVYIARIHWKTNTRYWQHRRRKIIPLLAYNCCCCCSRCHAVCVHISMCKYQLWPESMKSRRSRGEVPERWFLAAVVTAYVSRAEFLLVFSKELVATTRLGRGILIDTVGGHGDRAQSGLYCGGTSS